MGTRMPAVSFAAPQQVPKAKASKSVVPEKSRNIYDMVLPKSPLVTGATKYHPI